VTPTAVKHLAVRQADDCAEISITGEDERVYCLTQRQLRMIVVKGMEVLSRLSEDGFPPRS
jgi:hypothetical protein